MQKFYEKEYQAINEVHLTFCEYNPCQLSYSTSSPIVVALLGWHLQPQREQAHPCWHSTMSSTLSQGSADELGTTELEVIKNVVIYKLCTL